MDHYMIEYIRTLLMEPFEDPREAFEEIADLMYEDFIKLWDGEHN